MRMDRKCPFIRLAPAAPLLDTNPGLRAGLSIGHWGLLWHLNLDPPHLPLWSRPGTSRGGCLAATVVSSCPRQSMCLVGKTEAHICGRLGKPLPPETWGCPESRSPPCAMSGSHTHKS